LAYSAQNFEGLLLGQPSSGHDDAEGSADLAAGGQSVVEVGDLVSVYHPVRFESCDHGSIDDADRLKIGNGALVNCVLGLEVRDSRSYLRVCGGNSVRFHADIVRRYRRRRLSELARAPFC
jgi:hypothetical protein